MEVAEQQHQQHQYHQVFIPPLALHSLPSACATPMPFRSLPTSPLALGDTVMQPEAASAAAANGAASSRLSSSRRRSFIGGLLALVTPRGSPSTRDRETAAPAAAAAATAAPAAAPAEDPDMYYGAVGVFGERRGSRAGSPAPAVSVTTRARSTSSPAPLVRTDSINALPMPTAGTLPKLLQWLVDLRGKAPSHNTTSKG